jgi:hypothetical protein
MNPNLKLSKLDCPTKEEIVASDRKQWKIFLEKYQKICGSGIFCMNVCRPDIAFAINVLTRQMHNPGETYMDAAIELVKYLAGTVELGILFRATGNRRPLVYCDSDRGSDESRNPHPITYFSLRAGHSYGSRYWSTPTLSPPVKRKSAQSTLLGQQLYQLYLSNTY